MRWYRVLLSALILFSGGVMAIEEPNYQLIKKEGEIELRRYEPMLIAEVEVSGDRSEASNKGFRLVADFIFGNNESSNQASQKIAMTAPVTIELLGAEKKEQTWRLHFVMPKEYTLDTLPKPKNKAVQIKNLPAKIYAVYAYSGLNSEDKIARYEAELTKWILDNGLKQMGSPQLARYNPPWTLPPFRRNEILIELESLKNSGN